MKLFQTALVALALVASVPAAQAAGDELKKVVVEDKAPDSVGVASARKEVKDGDKVAVKGKVKDFVDGAAVLTIVDLAIKSCDQNPGDACKTPWDYCCETKDTMSKNSATVMVVKGEGEPVDETLKGVGGLDHLAIVVAEGKAKKDDAGNLVVEATKIYKEETKKD